MRNLLVIAALTLAGCSVVDQITQKIDPHPMTPDARHAFNGGLLTPACIYDMQTGNPIDADCRDLRQSNHPQHNPRSGFHVLTGGHYSTPATLAEGEWQAALDAVPAGVTVNVYPRVADTEVVCYIEHELAGQYPRYVKGCYNPATRSIHVTAGDTAVLAHEIRHHTDGNYHE